MIIKVRTIAAVWFAAISLLFSGCSLFEESPEKVDWKAQSNKWAEEFVLSQADRYPERASSFGYTEYDDEAIELEDDMESANIAHLNKWKAKIEKGIAAQGGHEDLLIDLDVLLDKVEQSLEYERLGKKYGLIDYCFGAKVVFSNLRSIVNPQSPEKRKKSAVGRFKAYVQGHGEFKPLLIACESRTRYLAKKFKGKAIYPTAKAVNEYLGQSASLVEGVQSLLEQSGRSDWQEDFKTFTNQVKNSDQFVREFILPKAAKDFRLPPELYAFYLKNLGVEASPEELIKSAKAAYQKNYEMFKELAVKVAEKRNLSVQNPSQVIKVLKKDQVLEPEKVKALYDEVAKDLSEIIKKHDLVSLPEEPLQIRLASKAESQVAPVPHLNSPPLIQNEGQRPEFVVPVGEAGKIAYDDFTYKAAAYPLTAHEGRPGHDLQFSSMLDQGTSIIRARYAFNSANIEGWGLYGEYLVFDHLPLEAQLAAMQTRLWRNARMFLDPELQLGRRTPESIIKFYDKDLGVSNGLAALEVRRYTYDNPGQATAYYYGLTRLLAIKDNVRERLGERFTERCFNDAVLNLGLLPFSVLEKKLAGLECS